MAFLGYKTIDEVNRMTLSEYFYRMYAREYQLLEELRQRYELAFAIRDVTATKNVGNEKKPKEEYIYKNIQDIIDYKDNIDRLNRGENITFKGNDVTKPSDNLRDMLFKFKDYNARKE
ncbi:hypothetical protein MUA48_07900 [Staphylococcus sp. IVB6238]|uniref:hypothetical protein n=1 Tax=Staphylococcus sp. IVB6238 TaxID=2989770 RepID=UPI0021CF77A8|nr:hypothetical protein [Staphylococcus sp. IVB6238]UXR73296.1 hypothetical protein MUA48_07900 [Staphylococcus sp. IVB6238]